MKKSTKTLIGILIFLLIFVLILFGLNIINKDNNFSKFNVNYTKISALENTSHTDNKIINSVSTSENEFQNIKITAANIIRNDINSEETNITEQPEMKTTKKFVVVKPDGLKGLEIGENSSLYSISKKNFKDLDLKQGQEILVEYDGLILESYPPQIPNVSDIKILKEKSEIEISELTLKYCYSSRKNVTVSINEITTEKIAFTIKDTNPYPYSFSDEYNLTKKVKNPFYKEKGEYLGEKTENSTPAYTGTGSEYMWEEPNTNDINKEDAIKKVVFNVPSKSEENYSLIGFDIDILKLYGKLESGEYELRFHGDLMNIRIKFTVDENLEVQNIEYRTMY